MDSSLEKHAPVLVVEDELMIALELCSMLEDAGCEVLGPAASVAKALSILENAKPFAAFLDENLRGETVAPVCHELVRRGIPFIVLSGYAGSISSDPLLHKARRLQKPASARQIRDAIAEFLAHPQERQA